MWADCHISVSIHASSIVFAHLSSYENSYKGRCAKCCAQMMSSKTLYTLHIGTCTHCWTDSNQNTKIKMNCICLEHRCCVHIYAHKSYVITYKSIMLNLVHSILIQAVLIRYNVRVVLFFVT